MSELRIVQLGINFAVKAGRNHLGHQSLGRRMKLKDIGGVECLKDRLVIVSC